MNSPIEVDCLEEYISHIGDIAKSEKSHLYRGLEDVEWEVKSSVLRRLEGIYTGRLDLLPYVAGAIFYKSSMKSNLSILLHIGACLH